MRYFPRLKTQAEDAYGDEGPGGWYPEHQEETPAHRINRIKANHRRMTYKLKYRPSKAAPGYQSTRKMPWVEALCIVWFLADVTIAGVATYYGYYSWGVITLLLAQFWLIFGITAWEMREILYE